MTLTPLIVLTDRSLSEQAGRPLCDTVKAALDGGAPAILFREKDLPFEERLSLADELAAMTRSYGSNFIVASDVTLATTVAAHAVHLASHDSSSTSMPLPFGRSCHDKKTLCAARDEGASYATLSPIFATVSKPGYGPALNLGSLNTDEPPLYALGGIDHTNAARCIAAGAAGIAVMGAIMRASDPEKETVRILESIA